MSANYRVYVTPLYSAFVYGTEIEITDYVENVAGTITKSIDSTDFSVGVYTFNDVQITCENSSGRLAAPSDSRSLFTFSRDKAKIRIVYDGGETTPPVTYRGLINDEGTTVQSDSDELVFVVLGPDSVLKNSVVPAGSITNGMTVTQALVAILNTSDVRSVLGVALSNLNPHNDITIDDGTKFDNLNKRDAIAELLGKSNSVLTIDSNLNVIVRSRSPNFGNPTIYLYGKGDAFGRENIKSIGNYNTGLHRTFNSVLVKGGQGSATVTDNSSVVRTVATVASVGNSRDLTSQALYGIRQKEFSVDWVTTLATLNLIAASYIGEFAYAKLELQVTVPTSEVSGADLLDQVSVTFPLLVTPTGKFLPVVGITKVADADSPLPNVKGAIAIDGNLGFKIIEKTEDITTYETTLKLRQIGVSLTDGGLVSISPRTAFVFLNNTGPADITGLVFDKTALRAALIYLDVRRKTDTAASEVRSEYEVVASYNAQADAWTISSVRRRGDDSGLTFTITSAGQVQYTSTNIAGTNGVHNMYIAWEAISA